MILFMDRKSTPLDRREAVVSAFLTVVAGRGVESASFRTVADEAGVSLGTVQHYFRTRDDLLAATYEEVLRRIRTRLEAIEGVSDPRQRLRSVLLELLPLDARRHDECVIHLAFAAVAPTRPALQQIQTAALGELHEVLAQLVVAAGAEPGNTEEATRLARTLAATADGLALHAVSTGDAAPQTLTASVDVMLDRLLGPSAAGSGVA